MATRPAVVLVLVPLLLASACHRGPARQGAVRGPALAPSGALNAGGEPQWSAQVRGGVLRFSTGADDAVSVHASLADHGKAGAVWSGEAATAAGRPATLLRLTVVAKRCEDGPTGMVYPITATLEAAGRRYSGCGAAPGQGLGPRS